MTISYTRHQRAIAANENKQLVTIALPGFEFQGPVDPEHVKKLDAFVMNWVTERFKPALSNPKSEISNLELESEGAA